MSGKSIVIVLALTTFALSAAPVRAGDPPTDSWKSNLDRQCKPDDIVDSFRALVAPETFWLEQRKHFQGIIQGGLNNIKHSKFLLQENRNGLALFRQIVEERADELKLKGKARRRMIGRNMADHEKAAQTFGRNIEIQQKELKWARGCLRRIEKTLKDLGVGGKPQRK